MKSKDSVVFSNNKKINNLKFLDVYPDAKDKREKIAQEKCIRNSLLC